MLDIKYRFTCGELNFQEKHNKLHIKYCVTDCLQKFYLHFRFLIMIQNPGNSPVLAKHRKNINPPQLIAVEILTKT